MVQLYIKYTDNNFYLLDLEESESINYKLTVKDLSDITKIFSPYTQTFQLKATDKNKILCGFIGNEKTLKLNNTGEFQALIYVGGFLFQSGILTFTESSYEFQDQKTFTANFGSTITSLTDKLGDLTIQDIFTSSELDEYYLNTVWDNNVLNSRIQGLHSATLSDGRVFKWGIPFISNKRVWDFNPSHLNNVDNIAYNPTRNNAIENHISLDEVRPAVNYLFLMQTLLKKFDLKVTAPIFDKTEIKDLFVWNTAEKLISDNSPLKTLEDLTSFTQNRYDENDDSDGVPLPNNPNWSLTTSGVNNEVILMKRTGTFRTDKWSDGLDLFITFNDLSALSNNGTDIKVNIVRNTDDAIIDSQIVSNGVYQTRLLDSMLDSNLELYFRIEILPIDLIDWSNIEIKTVQQFYNHSYGGLFNNIPYVTRCKFSHTSNCNTDSSILGGNVINLITTLPKIKCVDFLSSFFKTFNISVLSTGLNDNSMFWLTPSDINEINKPYSKRIVDYTQFVDISSLNKKSANQYNQYSFSHFDSKYYEAVYGDGTKFGSLTYPSVPPTKPTKFEVKTNYSILKQSTTFPHNYLRTCLGFSKDSPTVQDNGSLRYKPVYDEFTLLYLQSTGTIFGGSIGCEYNETVNSKLNAVLVPSFVNFNNAKSLAFGAEGTNTNSLYINYYKTFIEMLLKPNTYQSEFQLVLPPNEIFLNFANLNQGESNIPTGFRGQNEIIIGEQRYTLIDSSIDLTSGKTKLTLMNF